jgi:predicted amidohydrolase
MARNLKIAAAQLGPLHKADSRAAAVKEADAPAARGARDGREVRRLPRARAHHLLPRWWMEDQREVDERYFEKQMPSRDTQPLFDEAKKARHRLLPRLCRAHSRGRRFNTAILVGPDGSIVGKYRKIHLPGHAEHKPKAAFQHLEKKYFEVGDLGFRVWRFMDTITGMLICNDRRWPEAFRVLALQGAEIVALGFNTPSENLHYPEPPALRVHHHLIMAQSMAFQNATWLVETAKAGFEDGFRMFGHSMIVAPSGEIAVKSQTEEDEVICYNCDIDLAANLKKTMFNFAAHRRPEHYRLIVERVGAEVTPGKRSSGPGARQLPVLERYKLLIGLVIPRPIAWSLHLERKRRRQLRAVLRSSTSSPKTRRSASSASTGAPTARSSTPSRTSAAPANTWSTSPTKGTANAMHLSGTEFPRAESEFAKVRPDAGSPAKLVKHPRIAEAAASSSAASSAASTSAPSARWWSGEILLINARDGIIDPATKRISEELYRPVGRCLRNRYCSNRERFN